MAKSQGSLPPIPLLAPGNRAISRHQWETAPRCHYPEEPLAQRLLDPLESLDIPK